jgi:hypothetical protein
MRVLVWLLLFAGVAHADNSIGGGPAAKRCPMGRRERVDREQVARLVLTLDDDADILHNDYTPSVHRLVALGLPGAAAIVDKLTSPSYLTRLHASRVIEGALARCYGWVSGRGFPNGHGESDWRRVWQANGNYSAEDNVAPEKRVAAAAKWRVWIQAAMDEPSPPDHRP